MKRTLIIQTAFVLFFVLWYFNIATRPFKEIIVNSQSVHYALNYLIAGLIPAGALFLLHTRRDILPSMGLSRGFGVGLLFAISATLQHSRTLNSTDRILQKEAATSLFYHE